MLSHAEQMSKLKQKMVSQTKELPSLRLNLLNTLHRTKPQSKKKIELFLRLIKKLKSSKNKTNKKLYERLLLEIYTY